MTRAAELAPEIDAVETLPGIGAALGRALRSRGLATLGDLVWLLPLEYRDARVLTPIEALVEGAYQVAEGAVLESRTARRRMGGGMTQAVLAGEGGGRLGLVWFKAMPGLGARLHPGARVRVAGVVEQFRGGLQMSHPEIQSAEPGAAPAGIVPRYPVVPGVPPRRLQTVVRAAVARCRERIADALPATVRAQDGLGDVGEALRALHEPPPELAGEGLALWNAHASEHHARLALEELFVLELALHRRRVEEQGVAAEPLPARERAFARAHAAIGFELTTAQSRALAEIRADLARELPMRRLLQGDVGSGKTAVALLAAAHAIAAGAQVAFMAPTEVLAEQQFRVLCEVARAMGFRAALALGGERASHRSKTRAALEQGRLDLVVGTHALLAEGVRFHRLRLVIIDEQHRFGVSQRLRLVDKAGEGLAPHLLVMTATPIPRSLALALYGDLSSSVIDELPPGRIPPLTRAYSSEGRADALAQLGRALEAGGQAFVVCPTIEPVEDGSLRCAVETHAELASRFGEVEVGLLHGRLDPEARQEAMERFVAGKTRVLVATTIIEVGVDVPRANAVLVDHAERFGLAQLHQLRGRVGRAGQRSACLLVHDAVGEEARARIAVLCATHDGFRIAEEDLRLRGPGELFGRRQSGLPGFRFADLRRDLPTLEQARSLARALVERDPELAAPENAGARAAIERLALSDHAVVKEEAG